MCVRAARGRATRVGRGRAVRTRVDCFCQVKALRNVETGRAALRRFKSYVCRVQTGDAFQATCAWPGANVDRTGLPQDLG